MGTLLDEIRTAVQDERYVVSLHATERCEGRRIASWQVVAGLDDADLVAERPDDEPNPSIVVRQLLVDGTEVEAVWSWLAPSRRAKLVTVYFPDDAP